MSDLVKYPNTILKTACKPFNFEEQDAVELAKKLKEQAIEHKGIGLSAPQIGIGTRAFIMGHWSDPDNMIPVFNPIIVDQGTETIVADEGCLSFPLVFVKVKRTNQIRVRFADVNGDVSTHTYSGITARVFQHEYDHLDGIVFTERANRIHMEIARKNHKIALRRSK